MADSKQLHAAIVENRARLQEAFHGAHASWDRKPAAGEGEDAWSPREVADHIIGSDWFFANMIAQACGAPALERPVIEAGTPAQAAGSLTRVAALSDNVLRRVTAEDMHKSFEGRFGRRTVEEMLTIMVSHSQDHVGQLEAASV